MKRLINTVLALSVIAAIGLAQNASKGQAGSADKVQTQNVMKAQRGANFVDADGDGICDNFKAKSGVQAKQGKGHGPGNGMGNKGAGPKDGTGYGAGKGTGNGTGTCDGTGPKGYRGGNK
jgi:hypothetical protein